MIGVIGRITSEVACVVSGAPYDRLNQYVARKQFKFSDGSERRNWLLMDVIKLAALVKLTDAGVTVGTASDFLFPASENAILERAWDDLGCSAAVMKPEAPQWYLIVTRNAGQEEPGIAAKNSAAEARAAVFPPEGRPAPEVAIVVYLTAIARMVRSKLEAIGSTL